MRINVGLRAPPPRHDPAFSARAAECGTMRATAAAVSAVKRRGAVLDAAAVEARSAGDPAAKFVAVERFRRRLRKERMR